MKSRHCKASGLAKDALYQSKDPNPREQTNREKEKGKATDDEKSEREQIRPTKTH